MVDRRPTIGTSAPMDIPTSLVNAGWQCSNHVV
jgi:hypothetical protein